MKATYDLRMLRITLVFQERHDEDVDAEGRQSNEQPRTDIPQEHA